MANPSETAGQERRRPWYRPRTKSQEIAWIIAIFTLLIGAVITLGPKFGSDETTTREYLVILLLGVVAIVFGIYVVERLWLQAGEKLAPQTAFPWRKSLRSEAALRQIGTSWAELKGRLSLPEVDLREASLPGIDLRAADLSDASLRNASLSGANLQHADLRKADLRGVDLRRGNLAWSSLVGATLEGARLERASLFGADLREADLLDVNLTGALYDKETCWPKEFSPANAGAEFVDWGDRNA
jgi:Pentapeptide repeats (8 copies)